MSDTNPFGNASPSTSFIVDPFGNSHPDSQKNYFNAFLTYAQIIDNFCNTLFVIHTQTDPTQQIVLDAIEVGIARFQKVQNTLQEVIQAKLHNYSYKISDDKIESLYAIIDNLSNEKAKVFQYINSAKKREN
jgi:hypothetical protein